MARSVRDGRDPPSGSGDAGAPEEGAPPAVVRIGDLIAEDRRRAAVPAELLRTRPMNVPTVAAAASARRPYLVVLAGPRVGEVIPVGGTLVIGREPRSGLHLLDEGVSRRHCTVALDPSGAVRLTDLDSTNGTWVGGKRVKTHALADGDRFRVGQTTVIKFALQDAVEEQYQRQLFETALRDPLTRAFNRRYFLDRFAAEVSYADRHHLPLALLFANLDRFELVNRLYGRSEADRLLAEVSRVLAGAIRTDDVLARMGDDTFALIARETGLDGGVRLADRLRGVVADSRFQVADRPVELRISLGVAAAVPGLGAGVEALLVAAQTALRRSKQQGRNRVSLEEVQGPPPSEWSSTNVLDTKP